MNIKYNKMVNKNTLSCWTIISIVLILSYILEIFKGLRTIQYVVFFSAMTIIPLIITFIINKIQNGIDTNIRYFMVVGYLIFYTFAIITSNNILTFVYIFPMIFILSAYCDKKLIIYTHIYVILINVLLVIYKLVILKEIIIKIENRQLITFYEIQIACILLSSLFIYKTSKLIKYREIEINNLSINVYRDGLTNVYNYRFLDENINTLFNTKNCENLLVSFIDIDNFKKFNDNYGHKMGDKILINVCEILTKNIKDMDDFYVIRVGGDEFVVIGTDIEKEKFVELLNKIIKDVTEFELLFDKEKIHVNISAGIAEGNKNTSFMKIYKKADDNLLKAKTSGKNILIY